MEHFNYTIPLIFLGVLGPFALATANDAGGQKVWRPKPVTETPDLSGAKFFCPRSSLGREPKALPEGNGEVLEVAAPVLADKPVKERLPKQIELAATAMFKINSALLSTEGMSAIQQEVLAKLKEFNRIDEIVVVGHTDRQGSDELNEKLSLNRARSVQNYMVQEGVSPDIISIKGVGPTQPLPHVVCASTLPKKKLDDCLAPNRRIEVTVFGDSEVWSER